MSDPSQHKKSISFTEKPGGTDASFPVSFANVESGTMRSDLIAGGFSGDDA